MSRTPIVAGNWKMNLLPDDARALARAIADGVSGSTIEIAVAPVSICLPSVGEVLRGTNVGLAAQNMHFEDSGAYTGEVAPPMLKAIGCQYVILGHSERRQYFGEDDVFINKKLGSALSHGLKPILCIGETLEEREAGETQNRVSSQIRGCLAGIAASDMPDVTIAYEPIWAIGTGRTASPEQAQEVHLALRNLLRDLYDDVTAEAVRIQYGGSVKPGNIADLISQPDIDGALVGGASLSAESFKGIIDAC